MMISFQRMTLPLLTFGKVYCLYLTILLSLLLRFLPVDYFLLKLAT
jgi:hypothetical protein